MAPYTEIDRDILISQVSGLGNDSSFEITSDPTPIYNCIGFAMGMNDIWVALAHPRNIPWVWWPPTAPTDRNPGSLVNAFEYMGFTQCSTGFMEEDFDKVALYAKNGIWTHAAKIVENNLYHSKMGEAWDIVHSAGDVFHNDSYGDVFAFMKRPIKDRDITLKLRPEIGKVKYAGKVYIYMSHDGHDFGWTLVPDESFADKLLAGR